MLIEGRRLVERATRWLVNAYPDQIDIGSTIKQFKEAAATLRAALPNILDDTDRETYDVWASQLRTAEVPHSLADKVAGMPSMIPVFDVVQAARATNREPHEVMTLYFRLEARLDLNWLRDRIIDLPRTNIWEALARAALRDDLYSLHRSLTQAVLEVNASDYDVNDATDAWERRHHGAFQRCVGILSDIKASRNYNTTTLPVAIREVRNLIRSAVVAEGEARP